MRKSPVLQPVRCASASQPAAVAKSRKPSPQSTFSPRAARRYERSKQGAETRRAAPRDRQQGVERPLAHRVGPGDDRRGRNGGRHDAYVGVVAAAEHPLVRGDERIAARPQRTPGNEQERPPRRGSRCPSGTEPPLVSRSYSWYAVAESSAAARTSRERDVAARGAEGRPAGVRRLRVLPGEELHRPPLRAHELAGHLPASAVGSYE